MCNINIFLITDDTDWASNEKEIPEILWNVLHIEYFLLTSILFSGFLEVSNKIGTLIRLL